MITLVQEAHDRQVEGFCGIRCKNKPLRPGDVKQLRQGFPGFKNQTARLKGQSVAGPPRTRSNTKAIIPHCIHDFRRFGKTCACIVEVNHLIIARSAGLRQQEFDPSEIVLSPLRGVVLYGTKSKRKS